MFDRMTDRACLCMEHARQEAQRLGHSEVSPGHLLLGMLKESAGLACTLVRDAGIQIDALREIVVEHMPESESHEGRAEFSQTVKIILELAHEEASRAGQSYVGTEHLLIGVLIETESDAAVILREAGMDLEQVRQQLLGMNEDGVAHAVDTEPQEMVAPDLADILDAAEISDTGAESSDIADAFVQETMLPPFVWERATERTRKCLRNAGEFAANLEQSMIEPGHLLLGLLKDEGGVACSVLKKLGLCIDETKSDLLTLLRNAAHAGDGPLVFSLDSADTLNLAVQEARSMEHEYIGTEHLVLGLMMAEDEIVSEVFVQSGLDYEVVRQEILKVLGLDIDSFFPEEEDFGPEFPVGEDLLIHPVGGTSPLDVLDNSASGGASIKTTYDEPTAEILARIHNLELLKQDAIGEEKFELAGKLRDQIFELTRQVDDTIKNCHTVSYTYDDDTIQTVNDLFERYAVLRETEQDPEILQEWLKVEFFRLPKFAIPQRPKRRPSS